MEVVGMRNRLAFSLIPPFLQYFFYCGIIRYCVKCCSIKKCPTWEPWENSW